MNIKYQISNVKYWIATPRQVRTRNDRWTKIATLSTWKKVLAVTLTLVSILIVPKVALAAAGDGLLAYNEKTAATGRYRTWTGPTSNSWSAESAGPITTDVTRWATLKASPANAGVYVYAAVDKNSSTFSVYSYSGGSWTSEFTAAQTTTQDNYRLFDVAFENTSGNVLVVYGTSTSTTTIYYQEGTWNGTDYDWTSGSTTFSTSIGNLRQFILANKLNADEMILAAWGDGTTNNINALVWNGSSFGNEGGAWGMAGNGTTWTWFYDAAYETASGDGMVAWGITSSPYWNYATYSGGSWTRVTNPTTLTGGARNVVLDGDSTETSNSIAAAFVEDLSTDELTGAVWNGSSWASVTSLDTSLDSSIKGRQADVSYVGGTGNAVIVYDDNSTGDLDYSVSSAGGAFGAPTNVAVTGATYDSNIGLVKDAQNTRVMYIRQDSYKDLYAYYYDNSSWTATNGGSALDPDLENDKREIAVFAYESVYRVDALGWALASVAAAFFVFVLVKKRILRLRRAQG